MKIIDSDRLDATGIQALFFPGGEPHVKVPRFEDEVLLYLKIRTWESAGIAALLIDVLQRQGCLRQIFMPYFPAARQDKTDGHAPLTLAVMGRLIGSSPINVFDPHSDKIYEHVKVARAFMPKDLRIPVKSDVAGIIAPDKGAVARATMFRDQFYPDAAVVLCSKERDPVSGRLSNYAIRTLPIRAGRYIIVDDICDGGGTFNLLADAFVQQMSHLHDHCSLELFVSHGIFSKGLDALHPVISHITTTDSWCRLPAGGRLTVLPLDTLFPMITGEHDV